MQKMTHRCSVAFCNGEKQEPWIYKEEWEQVYSWLYSSNPKQVKRGVGRVAAWRARGETPMMVELTADLCECRVQERKRGEHCQAPALQYSMAITRYGTILSTVGPLYIYALMSTFLLLFGVVLLME